MSYFSLFPGATSIKLTSSACVSRILDPDATVKNPSSTIQHCLILLCKLSQSLLIPGGSLRLAETFGSPGRDLSSERFSRVQNDVRFCHGERATWDKEVTARSEPSRIPYEPAPHALHCKRCWGAIRAHAAHAAPGKQSTRSRGANTLRPAGGQAARAHSPSRGTRDGSSGSPMGRPGPWLAPGSGAGVPGRGPAAEQRPTAAGVAGRTRASSPPVTWSAAQADSRGAPDQRSPPRSRSHLCSGKLTFNVTTVTRKITQYA